MSTGVLVTVQWVAYFVQFTFWLSGATVYTFRNFGKEPKPVVRWSFRITRSLVWYAYAVWCLALLLRVDEPSDLARGIPLMALMFWINWSDWKRSKDLDDDDWMKKLIEKGLGEVQRYGNRLRVVVPAPAGA